MFPSYLPDCLVNFAKNPPVKQRHHEQYPSLLFGRSAARYVEVEKSPST